MVNELAQASSFGKKFEKIIYNSPTNSLVSEDFQKIKDNSPSELAHTRSARKISKR